MVCFHIPCCIDRHSSGQERWALNFQGGGSLYKWHQASPLRTPLSRTTPDCHVSSKIDTSTSKKRARQTTIAPPQAFNWPYLPHQIADLALCWHSFVHCLPKSNQNLLPTNCGTELQHGAGTSLLLEALRLPKRFTRRTVVAIEFHLRVSATKITANDTSRVGGEGKPGQKRPNARHALFGKPINNAVVARPKITTDGLVSGRRS